MRFLNFPARACLFALASTVILGACRLKPKVLKSPPHYNFSQVYEEKLDLKLREISGICWDPKNNFFAAVNDESGTLFLLDKESKQIINEYPFGPKGDYEDVAILNGTIYVLESKGLIIRMQKDSAGDYKGVNVGTVPLNGTNDFETMYGDPTRKALVILCKNCSEDKENEVNAYAFYPDSIGFDNKPLYVIDTKAVEELSPFSTSKFQPSGAAIHPVLQKLFILSAASSQLVVADLNGRVESVHKLTRKLFPQPEGITFKQTGDLYISNEGVGAKATLLKFKYSDTTLPEKAADLPGGQYDFAHPDEIMELGKHLHEISGMAYVPKKDLILGENDEKGDIFSIDFKNKADNLGKVKFGGKGDYEDIVYTDTAVYMLISSGTIVQVMTKDSSFATQEYTLSDEKNEFETLYLGADKHSLVMLCKQCGHEKDQVRSAYRFDLKTMTFDPSPLYTIRIDDIRQLLNDDKAEYKPSAAAISPINGKLYIVASVGKLLTIGTPDGKIEKVYRLDPSLYNQPEGMTFAPNGDLYISNEGGEGVGRILKFNYRK